MDSEMKQPIPTRAYLCYDRYRSGFFAKKNIARVLKQVRDFVAGKQYREDTINDMPKPVFNICREYEEKAVAKILEVKPAVQFIADSDEINLKDLDNFYDYQMKKIGDQRIRAMVAKRGWEDGMSVCVTAFDVDTLGCKSLFRGFIKRQVIPFEDTYWENPYCGDVQDQRYWGYKTPMEISAIKRLLKSEYSEDDREYKRKLELIKPEEFFGVEITSDDKNDSDIDSEICPVYYRFFRIDGEVAFEVCTKYVCLFKHPHFLNPRMNEKAAKALQEEFEKRMKKEGDRTQEKDTDILDYEMDDAKHLIFERAIADKGEYEKEKGKFSLYPVTMFRPYPMPDSILGESAIKQIIPNQKMINLTSLNIMLIMQNHSMPKWLVKNGALRNQVIDNSPSQTLIDYTPITSNVQWGVTSLSPSNAVNSNLIGIQQTFIDLTRSINGFDNLVSDMKAGTSGYQYEQLVHESNLVLEQPQQRLWDFVTDNAKIDLMYFKHYVDKANYYVQLSDSEMELQENYRNMSQRLENKMAANDRRQPRILPSVASVKSKDISGDLFDADFDVCIEVEQGIASSQISEAQHYENVYQYIMAGNVDADKIKVMVQNDPAFSRKVKSSVMASLESLEVSQLQLARDENDKLKSVIEQLTQSLKQAQQGIAVAQAVNTAQRKGFEETTARNKALMESAMNNTNVASEGQVKSNNAKGKEGTKVSQS